MEIIRNTYKDIVEAVKSFDDDLLLKIANEMIFNDDNEILLNTKDCYKDTDTFKMLNLIEEGCTFDPSAKYLCRWNYTTKLDADCTTINDIFEIVGVFDIANYIDENNGFKDIIYLVGNRYKLEPIDPYLEI